jgi:hypothetical protein
MEQDGVPCIGRRLEVEAVNHFVGGKRIALDEASYQHGTSILSAMYHRVADAPLLVIM